MRTVSKASIKENIEAALEICEEYVDVDLNDLPNDWARVAYLLDTVLKQLTQIKQLKNPKQINTDIK